MKTKTIKKILKIIASITVFFRMHDFCNSREARLSIIEYSMQKLDNPYLKIISPDSYA